MAALLSSFLSLSIAGALDAVDAGDASDDTRAILLMLLLLLPLAVSYWWTRGPRFSHSKHSKGSARRKAEAGQEPPPPPAAVIPVSVVGVPAPQPRVIRLYSTTPGQSPNEYNIGDGQVRRS